MQYARGKRQEARVLVLVLVFCKSQYELYNPEVLYNLKQGSKVKCKCKCKCKGYSLQKVEAVKSISLDCLICNRQRAKGNWQRAKG